MDLVRDLMSAFENADIDKMKIEMNDLKLELEKHSAVMSTPIVSTPVAKDMQTAKPAPVNSTPAETQVSGYQVKSPIVGVFYEAPSADSQPFVRVGDKINAGDTLCIIEAMKVMNEIKAPVSGTIKAINVSNEDLVQFDEEIMVIEENV